METVAGKMGVRFLIIALAFLVAACASHSSILPTTSGWQILYSPGMPARPTPMGNGWYFNFPQALDSSVHYVVLPINRAVGNGLTANFEIVATAGTVFVALDNPCNAAATVRLFLQRQGDNLSGQGDYEFYRWWGQPYQLKDGAAQLSQTFDRLENWISVYGKNGTANPAAFAAALANTTNVGLTFGGCFAGHGVQVKGSATFNLSSFVYG